MDSGTIQPAACTCMSLFCFTYRMNSSKCILSIRLVVQVSNPLSCKKPELVQQLCCHCAINLHCTGSVHGADAHFHTLNQLSQVQGQPVHIYLSLRNCFNCNLWGLRGIILLNYHWILQAFYWPQVCRGDTDVLSYNMVIHSFTYVKSCCSFNTVGELRIIPCFLCSVRKCDLALSTMTIG